MNPTLQEVNQAIEQLKSTMVLPEINNTASEVQTVAQQASEKLGYGVLLSKTGDGILRNVLVDLDIEAMDKFAVHAYQKKFGIPLLNPHKMQSVASGLPTGFVIDARDMDIALFGDDEVEVGIHTMIPGAARFSMSDAWGRTAIRYYEQEIPEFVLNKALQIKESLPDVGVYVEHLLHQPDPFLVVSYGGEEFYVEVWAEPGFEGRVTKETKTGRLSSRSSNVPSRHLPKKHRR